MFIAYLIAAWLVISVFGGIAFTYGRESKISRREAFLVGIALPTSVTSGFIGYGATSVNEWINHQVDLLTERRGCHAVTGWYLGG